MIDSINGVRSDNNNDDSGVEAFLNQPKHPEWDCLLIACQKGNASAVKRILRENPSSKSHANVRGQSALHIAAWWNHVTCVEVLLESGADVHATNSLSGATPLHECLQSNKVHRSKEKRQARIECLVLLLQGKADPNAVDRLGKVPLECFALADDDDVVDYAEIVERIAEHERATNNPFQILVQKFISREITRKEVEKLWLETVDSDSDVTLTYELLSTEVSSMTEAWIDRVENASDEIGELEAIDNGHYLDSTTWMWSKIFEVSPSIEMECKIDHDVDSFLHSTLSRLVMAIFDRYDYFHKAKKYSFILQEDVTLSSWTELAILLVEGRDKTNNANGTSPSKYWTRLDNIQQTWMTIARRDYFDLAQLWWDRFNITPIGIRNRQGMTVLQFAARSGHFRMVKWLTSHQLLSKDISLVLQWIESQDKQGQTALTAAKANQREQIVELLQGLSCS